MTPDQGWAIVAHAVTNSETRGPGSASGATGLMLSDPVLPPFPMTIPSDYVASDLRRADIDALDGPVVVDFGTNWCGYCGRTRPLVDRAMAGHPSVRHLRIEDGPGRRLGRSFGVKLWPTLVFLAGGQERGRLVRPADPAEIEAALVALVALDASP